jgi:hypothetical protein
MHTGSTNADAGSATWRWILLVNLAAAFYSVGTVWLAQLNWQLWQYVGRASFDAYHHAWFRGIWWAIFPVAGVAVLGVCAQVRWRPPRVPVWAVWLALVLQVVTYVGTGFGWGPGQAALKEAVLPDGGLAPQYVVLLQTNWLRVALITMAGLLELWMAVRSFVAAGDTSASRSTAVG